MTTESEIGKPRIDSAPRRTIGVRARILATVLILAGLGMSVTGGTSVLLQHRQLMTRIDAELATTVSEFRQHAVRAATDPAAGSNVPSILRSALEGQVPSADQVQLALVDGRPAFITPGARPFPIEKETALIAEIAARPRDDPTRIRQGRTAAVGPIRYAAVQLQVAGSQQRGVFVVATTLEPTRQTLIRSAWQYTLLSASALFLIGAGGWLVAGRLLRPLRLLRDAAEHISHTDLASRIPATGHDDVTELTRTVNAMLDRLEGAFDTQQQFLDDAGHELRTPLTIVRGHLEILDPEDAREVAATRALALDELDRMSRLVSDLIVLAQSGRPDFVRFGPVDLDHLLHDVLDKAGALADRHWVLESRSQIVVLADAQRLTQAMLQLADNAVRHTGPGDLIAFGTAHSAAGVMLWVRDTGCGVAPEDAERIFERFGRSGTVRGHDGSGLGLSIVAGIAAAHGGRVKLDRPAAGPGALFSLVLPLTLVAERPDATPVDPARERAEPRG